MDITAATPAEIDTAISALYGKVAERQDARQRAALNIERIDSAKPGSYESMLPGYSPEHRAELLATVKRLDAEITGILERDIAPLDDEFDRRGGWTRYYLVTNTGGHVHSSEDCKTCYSTTRYAWLTEQSGMSAEDLVELAGEKACTECFDWAPVNTLKRKTRLEAPEAKAAREEREAKAAAKAKAAADKSISTPEGEKLYASKYNESYNEIKNIRTAEIAATDALKDLIFAQQHAKDPAFAWMYESGRTTPEREQMEYARHAWCLIRSIAFKKAQTFEETFQVHEKKAQAKVRKIEREWAKDPRNPNRSK